MDYALDRFAQQAHQLILAAGRVPEALVELVQPKPNIPADLAFPTFRAARELGVPPPQLAQELAQAVRPRAGSLVAAVAAAGPFVNFTVDAARLAAEVLAEVERLGARYGADDIGAGKTVVVDYSSPNIARRMHIGHIRSTIIGQALYNIFSFLGYRVIGDNHLGDWGKQFGVLIMAIVRDGTPQGEGEEALAALEQLYSKYNALAERDPAFDEEARLWSLRLEQGDPQARELWQWIVDLTLRVNQRLYDRLGVRFDTAHGESFYSDKMEPIIAKALDQGVAFWSRAKGLAQREGPPDFEEGEAPAGDAPEDEGEGMALAVELPGLPTFLLQRSDGGTLYHTRDAATIVFREHEYHPERIIYAVDARQSLHFRQLFALMRALGYAQHTELVHVGFGTIFDAQGRPFSTRKGNMIYLEALLNEAHARARAVVEQTSPELPEAEKEQIAEAVGVGAVIYNDLYQDPRRNITLDWDRMLSIVGNSAPYIQYMHARCRSILRKAAEEDDRPATGDRRPATGDERASSAATPSETGADPSSLVASRWSAGDPALLTHPAEVALVKQLAKLPRAVREAGERYAPFVVAEWCYETARATSAFYEACSVLKAETPELRAARLRLVAATAQALKNGLALLSIRAPERM
ncbi:MAG TPA: arginine--tRNA ligase [Roseiflexaceae bacterium]|nr:arginine--tRNA ligase [Roseiflexaceae bacterium]